MAASKQRTYLAIGLLGAVLGIVVLVWAPWSRPATQTKPPLAAIDAGGSRSTLGKQPALTPVKGIGAHSITGWVRGADASAFANAQVIATLELGPGVRGVAPKSATAVVAISGADGAFTLEGLEPGRHRLRIEGEGLVTAELRFVEAPGAGLVILVSREVSVGGRVVGALGDSAEVRVFLRSETSTQMRDVRALADGSFAFPGLAEGRFQLWAQGPGQASPTQWVERLGLGPFEEATVAMQTAHTLTGRVVEQGNSEFGLQANVSVQSALGQEPARQAISNADGSFVVEGLLEGRWIATASAPGYMASESQSFLAGSQSALLLSLDGGGRVSGVIRSASGGVLADAQIQLIGVGADGTEKRYGQGLAGADPSLALAAGQRFIERGELGVLLGPIPLVPPPGAYVSRVASVVEAIDDPLAETVALGRSSQFTTDELGRYELFGVDAGRYRVHVRHPDFADSVSRSFDIRPKSKGLRRNVVLRSGTNLTGAVLTELGVAVVGASVFARFSDEREQALAVTGDDGRFTFAPMSGPMDIVIEAVGFGRYRKRLTLGGGGIIASAKHLEVRLVKADAVMEGRLVDAAGFPIRDASVALVEGTDGLPVRPTRTGADGLFRLDGLLPGTHLVKVSHPEYPPYVQKAPAAADVELVVPIGASVVLKVIDAGTGAALAMVDAVLVQKGNGGEWRSVTDADGTVSFSAIPSGPAVVDLRRQGYATLSKSISLKARSQRSTPAQQVSMPMSPGSILAGIVLDANGDRLEGASLSVGESRSTSDSEGRFRLEDAPSGAVTLMIEKAAVVTRIGLDVESGEERVTMEVRALNGSEGEGGTPDEDVDDSDESLDEEAIGEDSSDEESPKEENSDEASSDET